MVLSLPLVVWCLMGSGTELDASRVARIEANTDEATLSGPQEHLLKMQKQKLQLPQQAPPPQAPPGPPPPSAQVPVQPPPPAPQQSPQLTTVTASRPGALLTGTTVANLQVARLVSSPRCVVS